jgi:hypothetical protein
MFYMYKKVFSVFVQFLGTTLGTCSNGLTLTAHAYWMLFACPMSVLCPKYLENLFGSRKQFKHHTYTFVALDFFINRIDLIKFVSERCLVF